MTDGRRRDMETGTESGRNGTNRSLEQKKGEKSGRIAYKEGVMNGMAVENGTARVTTREITGGIECIILDVYVYVLCVSTYCYVYCNVFLVCFLNACCKIRVFYLITKEFISKCSATFYGVFY